ncbi:MULTISPECIES: xanthine dehydrogenase family protein molybdopterin-binding subunit [unclassified Rhodococcus (in: high G+C Gram-positive bacteria)]|uniref:xanthine dehydrogenase family protein molybdopterin-binding subunit n=1 Tax=unclassified Rhodococcus (in: high G+C Gram-positive bacteria) TaxID=192944 RepID=UPI00163B3E44|nr:MULTISPECIES: xanthine dehydrogenase family protein molybdopterin-binding subunit [unclassified Rhodococcus (in: high G+C Gram-positive bacteria)]MBC2638006.1 xanthine dehydrogenase family protein molybdopterin-binding subunit [Rhodococcus sp. 3A]MBC2897247.1 xanthine dehydrogenase family protein molybdopterin-binding subunit [Rhodococcus sp. 4CII]
MTLVEPKVIGTPTERVDAHDKVTGTALYAFEHPVDDPTYLFPVLSTIGRGRVTAMHTADAEALDGVVTVLTVFDAPRLDDTSDAELAILQDPDVHFRGQFLGAVVADSPEVARHAAGLVRVDYEAASHDTEFGSGRDDLYAPEEVNAGFPTDTEDGDVDDALAAAAVTVDQVYSTAMEHNNPMEPHASIARWTPGGAGPVLTLHDSTQGVHSVRATLAPLFGLEVEQVRVIAPYVGGGFGSKGLPHAHNVLAVMAAQRTAGRPVKFALTRQQMFALSAYRAPTVQHIRLGADADGRLTALSHEVITQSAKIKEFAEQAAVPSRMMYSAATRYTTHRLASLDVPAPSWMRAPGETPGMFAAEVAMDELAEACGLDPIELRIRNEPEVDPSTGRPWSGRRLTDCLQEGARLFGWADRDAPARPGSDPEWLVGTGVASATYPANTASGSVARIVYQSDGTYTVQIGSVDIGTGAWTALTQIAADALGCPLDAIDLHIGDTDYPSATVAGGSTGTSSWGGAIVAAARAFRDEHGTSPQPGAESSAGTPENRDAGTVALHSFGAHFVEAHVHRVTCEIRVERMLGVFAIGRVINARTVRSQMLGGMTMGVSMALHESSVNDPRFGHVVTQDLASYHVSTHADIGYLEAVCLDDVDGHANAMGSKGAGEIGIVGAAAAVANAVHHATGIRVRKVPIHLDDLLPG